MQSVISKAKQSITQNRLMRRQLALNQKRGIQFSQILVKSIEEGRLHPETKYNNDKKPSTKQLQLEVKKDIEESKEVIEEEFDPATIFKDEESMNLDDGSSVNK